MVVLGITARYIWFFMRVASFFYGETVDDTDKLQVTTYEYQDNTTFYEKFVEEAAIHPALGVMVQYTYVGIIYRVRMDSYVNPSQIEADWNHNE